MTLALDNTRRLIWWVIVSLRVIAVKYTKHVRSQELEPHHQIQFSAISWTPFLVGVSHSSLPAKVSPLISEISERYILNNICLCFKALFPLNNVITPHILLIIHVISIKQFSTMEMSIIKTIGFHGFIFLCKLKKKMGVYFF